MEGLKLSPYEAVAKQLALRTSHASSVKGQGGSHQTRLACSSHSSLIPLVVAPKRKAI